MTQPSIEVLYEDNHILAVNKPAGLLTQPTDIENDSLETSAKQWLKEKYQKPGNVFVGVVHRLDRPASGIVILAKTSKALSRLNQAMRSKEMQKTYYALVEGTFKKKQDTLEHFLKHDDHCSCVVNRNDPEGKRACLHYKVVKEAEKSTLVEVVLETGRYHQIRCQLSAIGHPIIGDRRYGAKKDQKTLPDLPSNAIALHHCRLCLIHPVTKVPLSIEAPTADCVRALEARSGPRS